MEQTVTVLSPRAKSRTGGLVLDLVKLTWTAVAAVEKERRAVAGASRHQQNDVSDGRNAGSLWRRCGGPLGFWSSWCARGRLPNLLVSFLKFLMTARLFVAGLSS